MRFALCAALPLAGLCLALTGCSKDGDVVIRNRTGVNLDGALDNRGFGLTGFGSIELSVKVGSSFLFIGPDTKTVALTAESCTRFPFSQEVEVRANELTEVTIEADAACIVFENESEFAVEGIYVREQGDTDWGESIIATPLPERSTLRRRFAVNQYEYLLVDECQDLTFAPGDTIYAGRVLFVRHSGNPFCETR